MARLSHYPATVCPRRAGKRVALALLLAALAPAAARAAGNAFSVEVADVGEAGNCKVDGWISAADNRDLLAVAAGSCVVGPAHPFELGAQVARQRADDNWATSVTAKVKTNLVPTAIGRFGFAAVGNVSVDALTGQTSGAQFIVPATIRFSTVTRLNLNLGWNWDAVAQQHYVAYGAGFDWIMLPPLTLTLEAFGIAGVPNGGVTEPRWQAGFRYRPVDAWSVDVIYGRNLAGERANWITLGTTMRFSP